MNYKVLYRKYRPTSFSQIVGQDYTIEMLQNAIKNEKISHAYLFTGPRGTGKTSTAKIFAKTINCEHPIDGEACGKCSNCLHFQDSPDIIEIDAASNNGVDDIRELINNVKIAPSEGKYKIYIIDEVHMMTTSAFNALLLTLEEPPKHAIFIMATTNVENVPITILSRCQRFNFQKISLSHLKQQISYVCQEENIKIHDDAIEEIAYLSEGGMRDALSLLDQLSSHDEEITVDEILSHYGSISTKFVQDLLELLEHKNIEKVHECFHDLETSSSDYKIFVKKIVDAFTQIAIAIKLGQYQGDFSYHQVKNIVFELNEILNKININMNPYVLIELTLLGSLDSSSFDVSVPSFVSIPKKEPLKEEPKIVEEKTVSISPQEVKENNEYFDKLKQIRVNNCFYGAKKEDLIQYQETWNTILKKESISPDSLSLMIDSSLVAASKDYLIISSKLSSTANLINRKIEEFTEELCTIFPKNVHFIALSEEEWGKEKKVYVQNIKNHYVYNLQEESDLENLKPKISKETENIATDVFNRDKIEVI